MKNTKLDREESRINQIAKEYRKKGYQVTIEPSLNELPSFLSHYRPDIIAVSNDESVIIEVKSYSNLYRQSQMSNIAEIVEAQPRWRFELVMTNPGGNTLITSESRLPSINEVSKRLTRARRLVKNADYESAIAIAWSAIEGLLRLIGKDENIALNRQSSSYVIKKTYTLGLIDNESYEELLKLNKIRNSVTHGLVEPNLQPSTILNSIELGRKILKRYRSKKMACICPVCRKRTAHVGTLFSHLVNISDINHITWLESYCKKNNVNFSKLLADRVKEKKDANKPLTDLLKRDFCEDY